MITQPQISDTQRARIAKYYIQPFNDTEWATCQPVVTKAKAQEYLADYQQKPKQ